MEASRLVEHRAFCVQRFILVYLFNIYLFILHGRREEPRADAVRAHGGVWGVRAQAEGRAVPLVPPPCQEGVARVHVRPAARA